MKVFALILVLASGAAFAGPQVQELKEINPTDYSKNSHCDFAQGASAIADGKLLLPVAFCPPTKGYGIFQFNENGKIELSPTPQAVSLTEWQTEFRDIAIDSIGRKVVAVVAWSTFEKTGTYLYRILKNGQLDKSFGKVGILRLPLGTPHVLKISIAPKGKIFIHVMIEQELMGPGKHAIMRLNSNGTRDSSFGENGLKYVQDSEGKFVYGSKGYNGFSLIKGRNRQFFVLPLELPGDRQQVCRYSDMGIVDKCWTKPGLISITALRDNSILFISYRNKTVSLSGERPDGTPLFSDSEVLSSLDIGGLDRVIFPTQLTSTLELSDKFVLNFVHDCNTYSSDASTCRSLYEGNGFFQSIQFDKQTGKFNGQRMMSFVGRYEDFQGNYHSSTWEPHFKPGEGGVWDNMVYLQSYEDSSGGWYAILKGQYFIKP